MKWRKKKAVKVGPAAQRPVGKIQEILPPEGVPLRFQVAPLGSRFGAQIIDILITVVGLAALLVFLYTTDLVDPLAIFSVGILIFFLIRVPYYAISEMIWNGQTLGKKVCRIRVISGTGRSLTAHQIIVRNLMREMEVFAPGTVLLSTPESTFEGVIAALWIIGLLAVPMLNKRNQRLGDIIANTFVIEKPIALLYPDIALEKPASSEGQYEFFPNQLDHYGAYELQVLAELLQDQPSFKGSNSAIARTAKLHPIGTRIRQKIEYSYPVAAKDEEAFLKAFYRAQRAYLEQKKLFGDARADKFHGDEDEKEKVT